MKKRVLKKHSDRERLLTVEETAAQLNVSTRTIYRLAAEGQVVGLKIKGSLRIEPNSVFDYIRRQIAVYALENGINRDDFVPATDKD